ncbi:hypothetical protein LCGC14_2832510, partial [marine sediment metagenome]
MSAAMGTAAIIGGGVIGGGWAARFLLSGWDVRVFDPDPQAKAGLDRVLANARRSLPALSERAPRAEGQLSLHAELTQAVDGADWIQESVPERLDVKHATYRAIQAACPASAIIGSSTSGFKPSQLQEGAAAPGQIVVAHPFNPVYLLPLVELVTTQATAAPMAERASDILTSIGMYPLHLAAEIDAHIADRLLESVWREALWLVRDGIATTGQIDDAIRYGFGLRWAQMGLFETYRIAGGAAGMRHFLAQFGPALHWPWSRLTDVPSLDSDLIEKIAAQSDIQAEGRSIETLERIRDDNLVAMLRALRGRNWGAGALLARADARAQPPGDIFDPVTGQGRGLDAPIRTLDRIVPADWTDFNNHMNEARYLEAFGDAGTRLMEIIG